MSLILSLLGPNQDVGPGSDPSFNTVQTTGNIGTAATGSTAVEYGDGYNHMTVLTVNTTLPAITGGVDQGLGKLIYTFPAGIIVVHSCYSNLAITQSEGNINADQPYVGFGTTIASGAVSVLSGTPAFNNVIADDQAADSNGTGTTQIDVTQLTIVSGDDHTVYFNAAASWSAGGDSAATLTGTFTMEWKFMS